MRGRLKECIRDSASGWMSPQDLGRFSDWLSKRETIWAAGHHASFTHPEDASLLQPEGEFHLFLTCSTIPLNSSSFARGAFHSGVKFPFVSEKHINKFVVMAPGIPLRYPKYRHLALPQGVDRLQVKSKFLRAIESVNSQCFSLYRNQLSRLAFELHKPNCLVLVPIEPIAKTMGYSEKLGPVWRFDREGHRSESGDWMPKYRDAVEFLANVCPDQVRQL